jgi:hypothetical protein
MGSSCGHHVGQSLSQQCFGVCPNHRQLLVESTSSTQCGAVRLVHQQWAHAQPCADKPCRLMSVSIATHAVPCVLLTAITG